MVLFFTQGIANVGMQIDYQLVFHHFELNRLKMALFEDIQQN